jgi:hypothetical protein
MAAGRLKALKCGRRTLIPTSEITTWLNSLSAKPPEEEARIANRGVHAHDWVPAWERRAQKRDGRSQ